MTDKLENFRSLLVSNQLMFDPKIEFLGQGEGNENYLAVEGGLKYVLRVPRQDISDIRDLYNEHIQLKFLESNDIDFAPRSIFYDKETGTNIISHVEGHDTSIAKLPMKMITDFVNNLILLDNLTFSNYKDF